jgi:hypothetical protein
LAQLIAQFRRDLISFLLHSLAQLPAQFLYLSLGQNGFGSPTRDLALMRAVAVYTF